jgi:hypothetical protein
VTNWDNLVSAAAQQLFDFVVAGIHSPEKFSVGQWVPSSTKWRDVSKNSPFTNSIYAKKVKTVVHLNIQWYTRISWYTQSKPTQSVGHVMVPLNSTVLTKFIAYIVG